MNALIAQLFTLQVALPLALILLNLLLPSMSVPGLLLRSGAVAVVILYTAVTGIWMVPPFWTPYVLLVLHGLVVLLALGRTRNRRSRSALRLLEIGLGGAALALLMFPLGTALSGRRMPEAGPDLAMPLGPGRYLVVSGGGDLSLNTHLATLDLDRARPWRGQSRAVDIIGIDGWGRDSDGLAPSDPRRYVIYGAEVLAPCSGTVALTQDGVPDMPVPTPDHDHMIGNAAMLDCGAFHVLLAHLAPGSVAVETGQTVVTGEQVGRVGNTGNTNAPHLHIHVQADMPAYAPIAGEPVWFTIQGRFLARNDRFEVEETGP